MNQPTAAPANTTVSTFVLEPPEVINRCRWRPRARPCR